MMENTFQIYFLDQRKMAGLELFSTLRPSNKTCINKIHFKMETLQSAIDAMRKNCYFGSVDLSEAFYSIPIRLKDRKFFRFFHDNQKYQFTALIMGLTHSPRVFTKILKPVFAKLRAKGHISSAYIDDSCLQGATYQLCKKNITDTVKLMDSLGLTVQPEKSVFKPTQQIIFLGFLLGMSFDVRFKVRTFGNKHPDGSNVRIFFGSGHNVITCTFTCILIECSLERTFIILALFPMM